MSANLSTASSPRPIVPDVVIAAGATRETTRARARDVLAMTKLGWSKEEIAEHEQNTPERVRQLLKLAASASDPAEPVSSRAQDSTVPFAAHGARPRRLTERTLVHRAVIALDTDIRLRSSPPAEQLLWLQSVRVIHSLGDGHGLGFGQRGDGFKSRADFAAALGGTDADLEALMDRGLLVDLEEDGIDLPSNIGLKPKQKSGGSSRRPADPASSAASSRPNGKAPVPGQRSMLLGIVGGAADGTRGSQDPNSGPNLPPWRGEGFGGDPSSPAKHLAPDQISNQMSAKDLDRDAANGTTATTTQVIESVQSGGGGSGTRAGDQNLGNLESQENLEASKCLKDLEVAPSDEALPDAPSLVPDWVSIAGEVARIVGLPRQPTVAETVLVRGWLDAGARAETLCGVVRAVMRRENCPSQPALSYFDGPVRDALNAAGRKRGSPSAIQPEAAAKTAEPPVSPETQRALDRLNKLWRQYSNGGSGPMPPANSRFMAAANAPAGEAVAITWLDVMEGYYKRNRTGDRPPEFGDWIAGAWKTWDTDDNDEVDGASVEFVSEVPEDGSG